MLEDIQYMPWEYITFGVVTGVELVYKYFCYSKYKKFLTECERNKGIFERILKDDKFVDGIAKRLKKTNSKNS